MQSKDKQWQECLDKAEKLVASYRSEAPEGFDPKMTWVAAGVGVAGLAVSIGTTAASGGFGGKKGGAAGGSGGFPGYQGEFKPIPNVNDDPLYGANQLNAQMGGLQKAAAAETAFQTKQREKIMPGSANQELRLLVLCLLACNNRAEVVGSYGGIGKWHIRRASCSG